MAERSSLGYLVANGLVFPRRVSRTFRYRVLPLGLALVCSSPALAAETPAAGEAAPQPPAGTDDPPSVSTADAATEEARHRYERGLSLYAGAEYVLALVEFERAYQLSPNYRVLYNIGQVRIQLGRYARAFEALQAYLEQGGQEISPERLAAVQKDLDMLAERTAKLTVITNEVGANISLNGIVIGVSPLAGPLIVDAGEHTVGVRKVGYYDKFSAVTLAGRDDVKVDLQLVHVKQDAPKVVVERRTERTVVKAESNNTLIWAGWAATGTLGVTAGVFGYLGINKANELESMRTAYGVSQEKMQETKSTARTMFLIADVAGASAVVLGGVSLYLTLSSSEKAVDKVTGARPGTVRLGINPRGVKLSTRF